VCDIQVVGSRSVSWWVSRELRVENIVGVKGKTKRAFRLETHQEFEFGAGNPGKGSCSLYFYSCLNVCALL